MPSAILNQIEETINQLSHKEQLLLIEQLAHHLREDTIDSDDIEQAHFEKQLEKMATDPEIQAELRKIDREFISTESDGLEN